jgi:hypothetical protein
MNTTIGKAQQAPEAQAFTIAEFAKAFRLSRATVYNLWRAGQGPVKMRVRGRVLISREAADRWRQGIESQAEAA